MRQFQPLGLFRAWSYPHPPFSCVVYPKPIETPLPISAVTAHTGQHHGERGQEDFSGLRVYQPNDSPRHIAWKAGRAWQASSQAFTRGLASKSWVAGFA